MPDPGPLPRPGFSRRDCCRDGEEGDGGRRHAPGRQDVLPVSMPRRAPVARDRAERLVDFNFEDERLGSLRAEDLGIIEEYYRRYPKYRRKPPSPGASMKSRSCRAGALRAPRAGHGIGGGVPERIFGAHAEPRGGDQHAGPRLGDGDHAVQLSRIPSRPRRPGVLPRPPGGCPGNNLISVPGSTSTSGSADSPRPVSSRRTGTA